MMKVKFGDVVNRVNIKVDRHHTDRIYYVGGEHIESNELMIHDKGLIKGSTIGYKFHFGFNPRHILFMSRNPHLRKCSMVNFSGVCSDSTYVVETKDDSVLLQDYLLFEMQSDRFWKWAEEHKSGGVNYLINYATLSSYEFFLPSLSVQRELSKKLWAAYRLKESYKKLLLATRDMVKSQFIEMFKGTYPTEKWEQCLTITNGKKYKGEYQSSGLFPICGSAGVMGYGDCKLCNKDTIILGRKGNINSPIYMDKDYWVVDTAFSLDVDKDKLNPVYFFFWCKLFDFTKYNKQGVLPSLTKSDLLTIEMPLPPMELQRQFVALYRQADKSEFELKKSIKAINAVIKSLLNN